MELPLTLMVVFFRQSSLNKLPTELRLIVSREIPETDWNLDALLRVMEREAEA